jgi:hypothetical protein
MTLDHDHPAPSVAPSREEQLARSLRRLLITTELNMDDMEEDTREAIREALCALEPPPATRDAS